MNSNSEHRIQLLNDHTNNAYVDLQHVTNLGLYNKFILVTQKQVLELYITMIECKTLYGPCIPHTASPNATRSQLNNNKRNNNYKMVHVTKIGTGT